MPEPLNSIYILNEADHWLIKNFTQIDEVVAILFLGRSGTIFLGSLFDDHPQVLMFPGTQLSFYEDFWERQGKNAPSTEILIRQFCAYFACFFDVYAYSPVILGNQPSYELGFDEMGSEKNEQAEINKEKFIAVLSFVLSNITCPDFKTFFQAIHVAFTIIVNRSAQLDKARLPVIVYALHQNSQQSVDNFCANFPKTKMLHMLREPFQAIGSHFQHNNYCCHILQDFYFEAFPKAEIEKSKGIKLEDLHNKPHITLKKIAHWIGIDWSDSLLESTYNGKKWWNVKSAERFNGFHKMALSKKYVKFYSKFDLYRLKLLYAKRLLLWGYSSGIKISKLERLVLLPLLVIPFKMEIIDLKANVLSQGLRGIKFGFFCWLDRVRRRIYLISAWKYALSDEVREVRLL